MSKPGKHEQSKAKADAGRDATTKGASSQTAPVAPGEATADDKPHAAKASPWIEPYGHLDYYERLVLIADTARRVVRTIRTCLPVAGEVWIHEGGEGVLAFKGQVARLLDRLERLLNPDCLPFGDPARRNFQFALGVPLCLIDGLVGAMDTLWRYPG
jgi:hypothetical protein